MRPNRSVLTIASAVVAAAAVLSISRPANAAEEEIDAKALASFVDDVVDKRMASCGVPGASVAVVWGHAQTFAKGYGLANVEAKVPVIAERTRFCVASVTKTITATAVMQLVEQGRLDLHADIDRYLPFQTKTAFSSEPITLSHLLTHTSGLEERNIGAGVSRSSDVMPLRDYLTAHPPVRVTRPGEIWSYANLNYSLAGFLVERSSGLPFTTYVRQNVLEPLAMHSSSFEIAANASNASDNDVAVLYENVGGQLRPRPLPFLNDTPAGGLYSTAPDMARFILAHVGDRDRRGGHPPLLNETTLHEMHAQHYTFHPSLSGMAYGFMEDDHNGRPRALEHEGSMGYSSQLTMIPELGIGVFVTTNGGGSDTCDFPLEVARATLDRLVPVKEPSQKSNDDDRRANGRKSGTGGKPPSSRLEGTYRTTRHASSTIEKLFVFLGLAREAKVRVGQDGTTLHIGKGRYVEVSPMLFERIDGEGGGGGVAFREGPSGRVDLMSKGLQTYRRVAWNEELLVHRGLFVFSVLVFVGTLVAGLGRFRRRRDRAKRSADESRAIAAARWLPRVIAILGLLFVGGLAAPFFIGPYGPYWLFFGIPTSVKVTLIVPFLMIVAVALMPLAAFVIMRAKALAASSSSSSRWAVVQYALTSFAGPAFLWVLDQYNLIGFNY